MGLKHAERVGQDEFGRAQRKMHIHQDMEQTLTGLCSDPVYKNYAKHIHKGCQDILGSNKSREALRKFEGQRLHAFDLLDRKSEICVDMFKVCTLKEPIPAAEQTECRTCAEAMMDLHFVLRRSARSSSVPLVRGKHRFSRKHILTELQELCYDTETRQARGSVDEIREMCERLVEEFEEEIVRSFVAREDTGQTAPNPVEAVCVGVTEVCDKEEFNQIFPRLRHHQAYVRSGVQTANNAEVPGGFVPTPVPPSAIQEL
eukprot:TRINITY_DN15147_c0_g1_i1.p1 TRINITY_DN15147_c0_g1~~TRINITY_DN15147_c0_g1_i1.p1  ORF type:complete len:259 (-),score=54.04 TRINITY_DN15147_c0_g1_i1:348-1124(-)